MAYQGPTSSKKFLIPRRHRPMKAAAASRAPGRIAARGGLAEDSMQGEGGVHTRLRARKRGGGAAGTTTHVVASTTMAASTKAAASIVRPPASQRLRTTVEGYAAYALWTTIIAAGLLGAPATCLAAAVLRTRAALAAAAAVAAAAAALAALPLPADDDAPPPAWADALCRFLITRTLRFLKPFEDGSVGLRVVCAPGAEAALTAAAARGRPIMAAVEPHSTLPLGMLLAFSPHAQAELPPGARPPPCLVGARLAASSACFAVPLVRHLWWWLGVRPADRSNVRALLGRRRGGGGGRALALCPGGVAEVALLTSPPRPPAPKTETLYLKARKGYVREALRSRAALTPVFILGQTAMLAWTAPPLLPRRVLERLSRAMGFMPLWVHNGWGLPCARRGAQLTVLVGPPVPEVEAAAGDPSPGSVRRGADGFIREIVDLVRGLQGGVAGEEWTRVVVV